MKTVVLVDAWSTYKELQESDFNKSQEKDFIWEERDYNY